MTTLPREAHADRPGLPLDRLLDHVRARSPRYFPDLGGVASIRMEGTRRPAYSELHQVAVQGTDGFERHLVVKIFAGARMQFRALEAVWPHFANHPQWRVPRPLDVWDEGPALVMEHVPGRPLDTVLPRLLWAGPPLVRATAACQRAGLWLRFYHDLAAGAEPAPLDGTVKQMHPGETLDALVRAGFDQALCDRVRARAALLARGVAEQPLPVSHVHGEFTVDNVLVDGPRVTGLDLWATHRGSVAHDLASFLGSLVLLRLTRPVPWLALDRLQRAFLSAYSGGDGHPQPIVTLLQIMGVADSTLEILERRRSRPARAWVRLVVASCLDRLARATGGALHAV